MNVFVAAENTHATAFCTNEVDLLVLPAFAVTVIVLCAPQFSLTVNVDVPLPVIDVGLNVPAVVVNVAVAFLVVAFVAVDVYVIGVEGKQVALN